MRPASRQSCRRQGSFRGLDDIGRGRGSACRPALLVPRAPAMA